MKSSISKKMACLFLIAVFQLYVSCPVQAEFKDINIDKKFEKYIVANPLLMEVAGVKLILEKEGKTVLLAVGSTILKDNTPAERLRAERVCRIKAIAAIVAEKNGIQVFHSETLKEKTKVVIDNKGESGESFEELIRVTKTKAEGMAKDLPVIGTWQSQNGKIFYLAVGAILNKSGDVLQEQFK